MTIGKLDMHYTGEGVYGTILFWDDATRELSSIRRENLIQALLEEIAQPMGVPNEFVVEFFAPTLNDYHVFHNLDRGDDSADAVDDSANEAYVDDSKSNTRIDEAADPMRVEGAKAGVQVSSRSQLSPVEYSDSQAK